MKSIIVTIFLILPLLLCSVCASVYAFSQEASTKSAVCGNSIMETGEDCDGADLGGQTCVGLGYASGALTCNSNCTFNTSACASGGGGGGGGYVFPRRSKVIFEGKAYPGALVTILKNEKVAAALEVDRTGYFSKSISGLAPRIYNFGIWAEDVEKRESLTLSYSIFLVKGTAITIGVFLPPTFEIDRTKLAQGENLKMRGKAFPLSNVNIFVSPNKLIRKTSANEKGDWSYKLDTANLALGPHTCKVQSQTNDGEQSHFSQTLFFSVSPPECPGADLNLDGEVNIFDFSILLYFWHNTAPANICADINQDKIVDLVDFSIMMYQWTE